MELEIEKLLLLRKVGIILSKHRFFPGFKASVGSIILSLIASFLFSYISNLIKYDGVFLEIGTLDFLFSWLLIFIIFIFIIFILPLISKRYIDNKQVKPSSIAFLHSNYDFEKHIWDDRFSWIAMCDYEGGYGYSKKSSVVVGFIKGPFCKNEFSKFNVKRTFWGRFKYTCPVCKKKFVLLRNTTTLKDQVINHIESESRMEMYTKK